MSVLEAVGTYIDTNSGDLTIGTNLFLSKMPNTPDYCVSVYEYTGIAPIETFGAAAFEIDRPSVQVVVRATRDDYVTARDKAIALRNLICGLTNVSVGGVTVLRVKSAGSVLPLGVDELDRPRVSFNVDCFVDV
jgi:hypothetical protein